MRFEALLDMTKKAQNATGPLGKCAAASLVKKTILNPHRNMQPEEVLVVDAAVLEGKLKSAGFVVHDATASDRYKARLIERRAKYVGGKKTAVKVGENELMGKMGHYVMIVSSKSSATGYDQDHPDILAHGRSDTREDAILQAIRGALVEDR